MAPPVLLPAPLPTGSINLAQLTTNPLNPSASPSLTISSASLKPQSTHDSSYESLLAKDVQGRLYNPAKTATGQPPSNSMHLRAASAHTATLARPSTALHAALQNASARTFLKAMARARHPLYFTTSLQTLTNPTLQAASPSSTQDDTPPPSPSDKVALPILSRRDSTLDTSAPASASAVFAVECRKVRCLVGRREEPHSLADIGYEWAYVMEEGEVQVAVGLGPALQPSEVRALAGMSVEEHCEGWQREGEVSSEEEFLDEGLAGF
jgi:hypothetical protein